MSYHIYIIMSHKERLNEIAKIKAQRDALDLRIKRYQEDLDFWIEANANIENENNDDEQSITAWSEKAKSELAPLHPERRAKLTYSYTLEVTVEKTNDAGNLEQRTYDQTVHEKTKSGAKSIAENIQSHLEDFMKKPYIKSLKLKNVEVMDVPFNSLDLSLHLMFQASPLEVFDHMKLNCNFKEINACVPLTLFERYAWQTGDGKTSKKLKINQLDILMALNPDLDPEVIVEDEFLLMRKGYHAQDVLGFCQQYRIKMLAIDHHEKVVLRHIDDCNRHLTALAFQIANNHMYMVDDEKVRKSIFATSSTDKVSKRKPPKAKAIKTDEKPIPTVIFGDIPELDAVQLQKKNIVHTEPRSVENLFYEKLRNKVVCNLKLFKCDKGVSSFVDEEGNLHYQNESYHDVMKVLKAIHKKYPKYPQKDGLITMTSLGWNFFNFMCDANKGFSQGKSFMSKSVQSLFTNNRVWFQTSSKKGWFQKPTVSKADLLAIDDNKHYTSCMMSATSGWSVFNIMDEVEPYDGDDLTTGFYYVESTDQNLLAGNDWYCEERVTKALTEKIIEENQIKFQIRAQESLPANYFCHFIKEIYELFGKNAKEAWNAVAGYVGRWKKSTQRHYFTQALDIAVGEMAASDNVVFSKILARDLEPAYVEYPWNDADISKADKLARFTEMLERIKFEQDPKRDDVIAYEMTFKNQAVFDSNYLPIHKKIYDLSAIKMYDLKKRVGGTLLYQHCDTIVVENSSFNDFGVGIGLPRKVNEIPEFDKLLPQNAFMNETIYEYVKPTWINIDSTRLEQDEESAEDEIINLIRSNQGFWLSAEAGCGKSTLVKKMQEILTAYDIKYESCAPTGSAASLIHGVTIHRLLGLSEENDCVKSRIDKLAQDDLQYMFVDEASMMDIEMLRQFLFIKDKHPHIKFIVSGDLNAQLDPFNERFYPEEIAKKQSYQHLCDYRKLELRKNWRLLNDPDAKDLIVDLRNIRACKTKHLAKQLFKTLQPKYPSMTDDTLLKAYDERKEDPLFITWTNDKMAGYLNRKWNDILSARTKERVVKVGKWKLFRGMPVKCCKNEYEEDYDFLNGHRFKIAAVDTKNVTLTDVHDRDLKMDHAKFNSLFSLCYAISCHSSQGLTINQHFTIYEADIYNCDNFRKWLYTAMSRTTKSKFVHFAKPMHELGLLNFFIYKIVHIQTGKTYVGSTTRLAKRIKEHFCKDTTSAIAVDLALYGEDAFTAELLDSGVAGSNEEIYMREQHYIDRFDCVNRGYNLKQAKLNA